MKSNHGVLLLLLLLQFPANGQEKFRVLSFFTAKQDLAHISFVSEANEWFEKMAMRHGFRYDSTSNWSNLNEETLKKYTVVVFLDTRPESESQRRAFQRFVEKGGGWIGFHFAAFALNGSAYPQNWDWYHDTFLGSGEYKSNTWRPTAETLKVENTSISFCSNLPPKFEACPNEWYRWEKDLRQNPDIEILLSLDNSTFPVGTGPKEQEVWKEGDYPVAWMNKKFRMVYINMGHNDMNYGKDDRRLSSSFGCPSQNQFILQALLWLGKESEK